MINVEEYIQAVCKNGTEAAFLLSILRNPALNVLAGAQRLRARLITEIHTKYSQLDYSPASHYVLEELISKAIGIWFPLVDHCNMNCAYCYHKSPIVRKPVVYHTDSIISDLNAVYEALKRKCPSIQYTIGLTGGDPLMHPHLDSILEAFPDRPENEYRTIVTNAIAGLKPRCVLALREKEFQVAISIYPDNHEHVDSFLRACRQFELPFRTAIRNEFEVCKISRTSSSMLNRAVCNKTRTCVCLTVKEGRLYPCSESYHAKKLGVQLPLYSVAINDLESMDEAFLLAVLPQPLCAHCDVAGRHKTEWHPSSRSIDEFLAQ